MRLVILFFIFWSIGFKSIAQKIDSVKYTNGFLYFHLYGEGETIILLSGGPGNDCHQIEDVAVKMSKTNRIVLLEQRGTGLSIPAPFDSTTINLKTSFDDINLVLDHLKLPQAILMGHSFGASLAMFYAGKYPKRVKSLILIAPGFFAMGKDMTRNMGDNMYSRLGSDEAKRLDSLVIKYNNKQISKDEELEMTKLRRLPYIFDKMEIDSLLPKINASRNMVMAGLMVRDINKFSFDASKDLAAFKKPIHLICGRQDLLTYVAYELKIAKPEISLYWIDQCGHFPMYETPEKFYSIVNSILVKN